MKNRRLPTLLVGICLVLILVTLPFIGACAPEAATPSRDYILIGHPTTATGPLAPFGETSQWAIDRAVAEINKDGGIFIKEYGKKLPIKVISIDTESNPTRAAEVATKLILEDEVDLMLAAHTPDTVNPVAATTERYEVPTISTVAPIEAWLTGGPYKWSFHFFWNLEQIIDVYTGMWDENADETSRVVGGLWPNDPDGIVWAEQFGNKLPDMGYEVVDVERFPYGMLDYTAFINTMKEENVDIVTGVLIPPDWATFWRQAQRQGFTPKMATIGKAILFPSAINALGGDLPNGLTSEVWWSPMHPFNSSLTGDSAKDLAEAWTRETGKQWTQPMGFDYALIEIAVDVLQRAGSLDKNKIREALAQTDLDTIVGPIKFNEDNFSLTPLVGGQWVKGDKWPWDLEIVYNAGSPNISKTAELVFPIPPK